MVGASPSGEEHDVAARDVEDVSGLEVTGVGNGEADGGKLAGVVNGGELKATRHEAGAIDTSSMGTDGGVVGCSFGFRRDVASGLAGTDAEVEGGRIIEATPFVGDALVDLAGQPPTWAVWGRAMADVWGVHNDAVGVGIVKDIASEGAPSMSDVGLGYGDGFLGGDLGRRGGVARDERGVLWTRRWGGEGAGGKSEGKEQGAREHDGGLREGWRGC